MSLYEELGVPKDASPEAVKRAYRKRAQQTHPDKEGGSEEEFKAVNRAYVVLSDPTKRKRYDETGDLGEGPITSAAQMATQALASVLFQVLEHEDVDYEDVVAVMRTHFEQKMKEYRAQIAGADRLLAKHERTLKRFKRKGEGENLLAQFLQSKINQVKAEIVDKEGAIKVGEDALGLLKDYEYEHDKRQVQTPQTTGSQSMEEMMASYFKKHPQQWRNL